MALAIFKQPLTQIHYRWQAFAWTLTVVGVASALIAIFIRLDIAKEQLHRIAFWSWCPSGTWHMTLVECWGPIFLIPPVIAWFCAKRALIPVWPARLASVLAVAWWVIGSTVTNWIG